MKYLKHINEEFSNDLSRKDASSMLMNYDTFKFNGTKPKEEEKEEENEPEDIQINNGSVKKTQMG